jgi:hypothetical protein
MNSEFTKTCDIDARGLACTPMAFMSPYYQNISAWHEHLPFALWIMENLRPRTVVELGTHYGVSYFAFCQAVKHLGLDTRCYAIDTWQGDPHAGKYDESVYSQVASYNNEHYSAFSRLVRSLFDKALQHFQDAEIDLLHIDGHHSYESVKHDFESWLPKMSESSVVILHDTNVREKGFGVFRLLEELRTRYPYFEFVHGHGLAVVGTGDVCNPQMKKLFQLQKNPSSRVAFIDVFARLGRGCSDAVKLKDLTNEVFNLNQATIDERTIFNKKLSDLTIKNDESSAELITLRIEVEATRRENESITRQLSSETGKLATLVQQRDTDNLELDELRTTVDRIDNARNALQIELEQLQTQLNAESFLLEQQASEYAEEIAIRFDEIATLSKIIAELEKLRPENYALRREAIAEIGRVVSAFAPTGPQRSALRKLSINRYCRALDKSDFFDADWYLRKYPDVAEAGMKPSRHYLEFGVSEHRLPNSKFDT